jgi:putative ATP-binding cassette transporter
VCHTYYRDAQDGAFVLGPLSLELRPAEIVFLTGGNGSGKTTLAKLLVGLYAPEQGRIWLDERVVTDATREAYRQQFSAVFSDFHLFDALLGADGADVDRRAARLLEALRLSHKVSVRDGVLSTTSLSLGQRKRLALLAAWLEERPVVVFDEWAADQDPLFKDVFYRHVLVELKARGKAVLVISHDDRYFDVADRRFELCEGRLSPARSTAEQGASGARAQEPSTDARWNAAS